MPSETRVAVVTGGSSGIGRGTAVRLAEEGLNAVVADVRRHPKRGEHYDTDATVPMDELVTERSPESLYVETDVSEENDIEQLVEETVDTFGRLDVLVNNAGILVPDGSRDLPLEDWRRQVDVNLTAHYLTVKHAVDHLATADHGRIVNISSMNAQFGGAGPAYAATKAGVVNLTRDMAEEFATQEVTNAVLPGVIKTPMQDLNDEETMREQRESTALPRTGEPRDVAHAVAFFASPEAEWVTGANVLVDGGYTAGYY
jgi:NAD(P)-dependent dehydrogenase (short-subunit alcohol dehydrogenase family)